MDLKPEEKVTVLLQTLDFHINEIHRREESEKTWFEWASTLLLATFGAIIALAGSSKPLQQPILIKLLATVLILIPSLISISRILDVAKSSSRNAEIVEHIEDLLHLFDSGFYDEKSIYPNRWHGKLAQNMLKRKTPKYFVGIIGLMTFCVIAAVWLIL